MVEVEDCALARFITKYVPRGNNLPKEALTLFRVKFTDVLLPTWFIFRLAADCAPHELHACSEQTAETQSQS
jgi:hypothetical protein